jgi:ABC-type branched-subunit amino acid transport system permease subunit
MIEFVKQYPAVILTCLGGLGTLVYIIVGWAITTAMQEIKTSLKEDRAQITNHETRLSRIEGQCAARHGGD